MVKYYVTSVEFGGFRSGEPIALEIAKKVLKDRTEGYAGSGKYKGVDYKWLVSNNTIMITLMNHPAYDEGAFTFNFEKIESRKVVDITDDKEHNDATKVFKENILN